MCLILFQKNQHPGYKLVVGANRDEAYDRPTAPAHFWEDHPDILAGRDLSKGGTWLGITKSGRIAAVTNIRSKEEQGQGEKKSRGDLIRNFLAQDTSPQSYLEALEHEKHAYAGFNLLVGNPDELFYLNNDGSSILQVADGVHGLSNHHLDTPWPKVVNGRKGLKSHLDSAHQADPEVIFGLLANEDKAMDNLPDTGFPEELERSLSPAFIDIDGYGTRSSTVLLIDHDNRVTFIERTFKNKKQIDESRLQFDIRQ
ncbi:NRDE family protein [Salinicoccus siamensis]|uniref:NRDE family protein n=2 Tax=Salinicoccus siamensis TaxID=381830 RepID=A0ABV5Z1V1_9STAP